MLQKKKKSEEFLREGTWWKGPCEYLEEQYSRQQEQQR